MPEHLASLTPSHQAMLAASRLLPQADSFSSSQGLEEGDTLAQMHASPFAAQDTSAGMPIQLIPASAALHATVMPYPDLYLFGCRACDIIDPGNLERIRVYAGSAPLEHVALQQAVDGLAAAVAAGYTTPADMSRKRKVRQHHSVLRAVQSQQSWKQRNAVKRPACPQMMTQQTAQHMWYCRQRAASAGAHLGRSVSAPCARMLMAHRRHWQAIIMPRAHGARSAGPRSNGCEPLCAGQHCSPTKRSMLAASRPCM